MTFGTRAFPVLGVAAILLLSGCGWLGIGGKRASEDPEAVAVTEAEAPATSREKRDQAGGTIWSLFKNADDPNTTVEVNKYLWQASLEVLNFLPIESVDPFTGVIVTGYGVPPGGGRAYRATVYVQDPALDARSLKVSLQSRGGAPVAVETQRAVEDAILTRARQLRIRDSKL